MRSSWRDGEVIILYTWADRSIARILARRLWDEGMDPILGDDLLIRDDLLREPGINRDNVIVLWSRHSRESEWWTGMLPEIMETAIRVVPLIIAEGLEDDPSYTLPDTLSTRSGFIAPRDAFNVDGDDLDALVEMLLQEFEFARTNPAEPRLDEAYSVEEAAAAPAAEALPDASRIPDFTRPAPRRSPVGTSMAGVLAPLILALTAATLFQASAALGHSLPRLQVAISARQLITSGALLCLVAAALGSMRQIVESIGAWKIVRALRDMPDFTDQSGQITLTR